MPDKNISLTNAEWNVMECLWEASPQKSRELVEQLKSSTGWSKSTTLTMLKRMTEKGLISCNMSDKIRTYSPCIDRKAVVKTETESFLKRVYKGSVSLMMSAMTKEQELSKEEIDELYQILKNAQKSD